MPTKFSNRHHEAIADCIRFHKLGAKKGTYLEGTEIGVLQQIVNELDKMFEADSPRYDGEKFVQRCGWHPAAYKSRNK